MSRNVEIKAKVANVTALLEAAKKHCGGGEPEVLEQHDTFFNSATGRLKLREQSSSKDGSVSAVELILYERPDTHGPKLCDYIRTPVGDVAAMKAILSKSNSVVGVVQKKRYLFVFESYTSNYRIHVDQVRGLGDFMEIEVCLKEGQSQEDGEAIARHVMRSLGINQEDLIEGAYVDAISE